MIRLIIEINVQGSLDNRWAVMPGGKSGLLTKKVPAEKKFNSGERKLMESATENNRLSL